jgi:RNA polymerase sigma-70 factor (ECF subfamily)
LRADKLIAYEELKDDIDTLLRQLPEKRRIIFCMNRFDGLSYKEIAEILSISIHTVQNQMVAAVKFLIDQQPRYK